MLRASASLYLRRCAGDGAQAEGSTRPHELTAPGYSNDGTATAHVSWGGRGEARAIYMERRGVGNDAQAIIAYYYRYYERMRVCNLCGTKKTKGCSVHGSGGFRNLTVWVEYCAQFHGSGRVRSRKALWVGSDRVMTHDVRVASRVGSI